MADQAAAGQLGESPGATETQQLAQKATTEQVKSDMEQAELQADRDSQLTKLGLKSDLDTKLSVAKWQELKGRYALSKEQLDISDKSIQGADGCAEGADREAAGSVQAEKGAGGSVDHSRSAPKAH